MAKPNRTAFLGRTTSWARWERTSRRLGRRGKSASLVSRVPDAEGRRQVAVSAENDAAGRVVELRHARCFAASVGCDCLARHDRQHFGLVMRQRLPADDYDHRALLVMALEREQPGCTIHQVLRQRSRPAGDSPRGWGSDSGMLVDAYPVAGGSTQADGSARSCRHGRTGRRTSHSVRPGALGAGGSRAGQPLSVPGPARNRKYRLGMGRRYSAPLRLACCWRCGVGTRP